MTALPKVGPISWHAVGTVRYRLAGTTLQIDIRYCAAIPDQVVWHAAYVPDHTNTPRIHPDHPGCTTVYCNRLA